MVTRTAGTPCSGAEQALGAGQGERTLGARRAQRGHRGGDCSETKRRIFQGVPRSVAPCAGSISGAHCRGLRGLGAGGSPKTTRSPTRTRPDSTRLPARPAQLAWCCRPCSPQRAAAARSRPGGEGGCRLQVAVSHLYCLSRVQHSARHLGRGTGPEDPGGV